MPPAFAAVVKAKETRAKLAIERVDVDLIQVIPARQHIRHLLFCEWLDVPVGKGEMERGLLICGTGTGMCIAANKVRGVRAASCQDVLTAEMSRRHNDANVLCLSADLVGEEQMTKMIRLFLETPFDGGRHARRVEKIAKIEADQCKQV